MSRLSLPKQFLPLFAGRSSFQETVRRVSEPELFEKALIVTHRDYLDLVERQLEALAIPADIILEPERRGSGPAILAGTMRAAQLRDADVTVLALAADHIIRDIDGFYRACRDGLAAAQEGLIVTFGITPDYPAAGYGYIEPGQDRSRPVLPVRRFIEKPDDAAASRYLRDGYLWNSGNFLFRASSLVDEYRHRDAVTVVAVGKAVMRAEERASIVSLDAEAFARAAHQSFDHAVMEKTARAVVVPARHDWADIGSWEALHKLLSGKGSDGVISALRSLTINSGQDGTFVQPAPQDEYWIVAGGSGWMTIAGEKRALKANDFVQIAGGAACRVESEGEDDLRILTIPASILSG